MASVVGDARRVLDYSELWNEASTSAAKPVVKNGTSSSPQKTVTTTAPASSSGKGTGWTDEGKPLTASSARKMRKVLTLIESGKIDDAETELSKLGTAKKNFEIQKALAIAKKRKRAIENGDQENGEEMYDYEDEGSQQDWQEEDVEMEGDGFDWQGGMEAGRQLTHAEIWDDSALIDAWNAAEEEYKIFHARRSAQETVTGNTGENGNHVLAVTEGESSKKRSALWYDSPAKGSKAAIAAKNALQTQAKDQRELELRKKRAKVLLAQVAGDDDEEEEAVGVPEEDKEEPLPVKPKQKRLKGTTPPSSSISGNLAWHSACATVSKTPNAIGNVERAKETTPLSTSSDPTPSAMPEGDDIFQNLAMAWYYAGYYQAMAQKWSAGKEAST
jgi:hypothetical protein